MRVGPPPRTHPISSNHPQSRVASVSPLTRVAQVVALSSGPSLTSPFIDRSLHVNSLLLVYPPPGDTAVRCLREYSGDALVYVGEGRGGVNANDAFFDGLGAEWDVTSVVELDPFPQCFERLFLLRRRREVADAQPPQEATQ